MSTEEAFKGTFITVGDACLAQALEQGKEPWVGIYDQKIKRKLVDEGVKKTIQKWKVPKTKIKNLAGTISLETIVKLKEVLSSKRSTKIEVEGEEDLLVIPCVLYAPEGTNVYYGQPNKGIVLVKVNEANKKKMKKILEEMISEVGNT